MFIPNYKYYSDKGYVKTGCIDYKRITNLHVSMARKNTFEVRAFLENNTDGKVIFQGSNEECTKYLEAFISVSGQTEDYETFKELIEAKVSGESQSE